MANEETRKINLSSVTALMVIDCPFSMDLMANALGAIGIKGRVRAESGDHALDILSRVNVDFILVDLNDTADAATNFIRQIRRHDAAVRFLPIVRALSLPVWRLVQEARDCGANSVLVKPFSPNQLLQRMATLGTDARPFVESETYFGPCRRVKNIGPPENIEPRRRMDAKTPPPARVPAGLSRAARDSQEGA